MVQFFAVCLMKSQKTDPTGKPKFCYTGGAMKIFLRISKVWSKPVENRNKEMCDIDGAKLWVGPGDQIYCDLGHDSKET
jgi:hypothetical protein